MKHSTRPQRLLLSALVATVALVASVAPSAHAGKHGPDVPATIAVERGHKVFLVGHAIGVQIYPCTSTAGTFAWGATTPRADLFDDRGRLIGTHFGGPTWRAKDGSTVVAARVDGVTVDPTAIPWLLLSATSTTAGPRGARLTETTFIQRTATAGGLAPSAESCNAATVGTTVEVPYTADYHFWKKTCG
jgi:hypothetical protein